MYVKYSRMLLCERLSLCLLVVAGCFENENEARRSLAKPRRFLFGSTTDGTGLKKWAGRGHSENFERTVKTFRVSLNQGSRNGYLASPTKANIRIVCWIK